MDRLFEEPMTWLKATVASVLLTGCVTTNVVRTSRHTREITVNIDHASSVHRVHNHLKYKANQLDCDSLEIVDLRKHYAIGICRNE